jgi:hypothetical protein
MVQPASSSVSLVVSRRPRNSRGRWAAPAEYNDAQVLPKPANDRRTLAAAAVIPRPVTPAEVAQARVFEGLLQAESAELHELAHRMTVAGDWQLDDDSSTLPWDLRQMRGRIDEIQRLLQALRGRFPHQLPDSDR